MVGVGLERNEQLLALARFERELAQIHQDAVQRNFELGIARFEQRGLDLGKGLEIGMLLRSGTQFQRGDPGIDGIRMANDDLLDPHSLKWFPGSRRRPNLRSGSVNSMQIRQAPAAAPAATDR